MKKLLICTLLLLIISPIYAIAALTDNTHSTDLENTSTQYWSISDASQSGLDLSGDMTINIFVKAESAPAVDNTWGLVAKLGSFPTNRNWGFGYSYNGTNYRLGSFIGDGSTQELDFVSLSGALSTSAWSMLTMTVDIGNEVCFYLDGTLVGSCQTVSRASIANGNGAVCIGHLCYFAPASGETFDGLVDDVRVWGRTLTPSEVSDLYSDPCGFDDGASIVSQWLFDNDGTDNVGSNNLTNNNVATFSSTAAYVCAGGASGEEYSILF